MIDLPEIDIDELTRDQADNLCSVLNEIIKVAPRYTHALSNYLQHLSGEEVELLTTNIEEFNDTLICSARHTLQQLRNPNVGA